MLKDLEIFFKSLTHSVPPENGDCWWDSSSESNRRKMAEHLSDYNTAEHRIIREILREQGVDSVLDAGCGVGSCLGGFLEEGIRTKYTGADLSRYMLETANSRYPGRFIRADVRTLPFADSSHEAVVVKHVLEHLEDYKKAVEESVRVASKLVVIDLFHRLLPFNRDFHLYHRDGFWENWYSRPKFEKFLRTLPLKSFDKIQTAGTSRQTAEIYVLKKDESF